MIARRGFLSVMGTIALVSTNGCLSDPDESGDDAEIVDSYLTIVNQRHEATTVKIIIHNETTETRVVDETVTIPEEERHESDFTVERDEPDGTVDVWARIHNLDRDDEVATWEAVLGTTETAGFSARIAIDGTVSIGVDQR